MLEKNMEALRKTAPRLAKKIEESIVSEKVTLFLGPNEDVNIAYEDIALHRMTDPLGEALEIFEENVPEAERGDDAVLVIFGLGLGYLLRRTFINTQGQIIVFEPYMDVLRQTLEAVDLSQELASKRVSIMTSKDDLLPILHRRYLMGDKMSIFALPAYHAKEPELYLALLDEIKSGLFVNIIGQNTDLLMREEFTKSSLKNLPQFLQYPDAAVLHGKLKGLPGVLVSAGPSLDKPGVLETLKANQHKMIIGCVGQAAKALDKAGIIPDFVYLVESKDVSQQLHGVSFIEETTLVLHPQAHASLWEFPAKRKLITFSSDDPVTVWISRALQKSLFGYNHQGTVSITVLIHLMLMGCNPIFLLGQDLAFPEGKKYAQDSVYQGCRIILDENGNPLRTEWENAEDFIGVEGFYKDRKDYEDKIARRGTQKQQERLRSQLSDTTGWQGEKLMTSLSYEAYRKAFEFIAKNHPGSTLINCSEGGAFIGGMEHLPFNEAVEKFSIQTNEAKESLKHAFGSVYKEEPPFGPSFQAVYERYQKDKDDLAALRLLVEEGNEQLQKASDELEQKMVLTHSLRSRLKKLAYLDEELTALTQSNILINTYIKKEMITFFRQFERKNQLQATPVQEGDVEALKENLESTEHLYKAIEKGTNKLSETLEPLFQEFLSQKKVCLDKYEIVR